MARCKCYNNEHESIGLHRREGEIVGGARDGFKRIPRYYRHYNNALLTWLEMLSRLSREDILALSVVGAAAHTHTHVVGNKVTTLLIKHLPI